MNKIKKGLSSLQINNKLKKYKTFKGVIPLNHLNQPIWKKDQNIFLILNTDYCNESGTHWIVLEKNQNNFFIFDSLVSVFNYDKEIKNVLSRNFKRNKILIQNIFTASCGYFCILYIRLRLSGFTFSEIESFFDKNTLFNENLLKKLRKILKF